MPLESSNIWDIMHFIEKSSASRNRNTKIPEKGWYLTQSRKNGCWSPSLQNTSKMTKSWVYTLAFWSATPSKSWPTNLKSQVWWKRGDRPWRRRPLKFWSALNSTLAASPSNTNYLSWTKCEKHWCLSLSTETGEFRTNMYLTL